MPREKEVIVNWAWLEKLDPQHMSRRTQVLLALALGVVTSADAFARFHALRSGRLQAGSALTAVLSAMALSLSAVLLVLLRIPLDAPFRRRPLSRTGLLWLVGFSALSGPLHIWAIRRLRQQRDGAESEANGAPQ